MLVRFGTNPDRLLLLTSRYMRPGGIVSGNVPDKLFLFTSSHCKPVGSALGIEPSILLSDTSRYSRLRGRSEGRASLSLLECRVRFVRELGILFGTDPVISFRLRSKEVKYFGMHLLSIVPFKPMLGHLILFTCPAVHVTPAFEQQFLLIDDISAGWTRSR
eukprot:NODE_433_length_8727_cov_0.399397.p2 type:complete len:161 gc:universal NODE_433_length_8727_cov_0.399397:7747-7265(-)